MSTPFEKPRMVARKVLAGQQAEGHGAVVRRSIGRPGLAYFDPFLLLDEFSVSPPAGFTDHPHRGFETVTYMLEGALAHQDFAGHRGIIKAGDLQWMTAGRGIIHCEMPARKGVQKGLQLWINLPAKDKMIDPAYQEVEGRDIPNAENDEGVKVSIIAGEALGVKSCVYTRTPTMYLDFTLKGGAVVHQHIPEDWNAFVYVLEGEGCFGAADSAPVGGHHGLILGSGNGVSIWNRSCNSCRFVLIAGHPLNEPMVQHGPFVMNSQQEINQTIQDYHQRKNGFERAEGWRSLPISYLEDDD